MTIDPNYKYVKSLPASENTEALKSNILRNRLLATLNALGVAALCAAIVWWMVLMALHFGGTGE